MVTRGRAIIELSKFNRLLDTEHRSQIANKSFEIKKESDQENNKQQNVRGRLNHYHFLRQQQQQQNSVVDGNHNEIKSKNNNKSKYIFISIEDVSYPTYTHNTVRIRVAAKQAL